MCLENIYIAKSTLDNIWLFVSMMSIYKKKLGGLQSHGNCAAFSIIVNFVLKKGEKKVSQFYM